MSRRYLSWIKCRYQKRSSLTLVHHTSVHRRWSAAHSDRSIFLGKLSRAVIVHKGRCRLSKMANFRSRWPLRAGVLQGLARTDVGLQDQPRYDSMEPAWPCCIPTDWVEASFVHVHFGDGGRRLVGVAHGCHCQSCDGYQPLLRSLPVTEHFWVRLDAVQRGNVSEDFVFYALSDFEAVVLPHTQFGYEQGIVPPHPRCVRLVSYDWVGIIYNSGDEKLLVLRACRCPTCRRFQNPAWTRDSLFVGLSN